MDAQKIAREMRLLAEARIDQIVGQEEILLTKVAAAKVCNRSTTWIDTMVAAGQAADHQNRPEGLDPAADRRRNVGEWIVRPSAPGALDGFGICGGRTTPRIP